MSSSQIKLTLTVDQVNGILQALGNMPYVQSAELINIVRNQAASQVPAPSAQQTVEIVDN